MVAKGTPIFPRLDMEEEIAYIQSQMTAGKPQEKEWIPEEVELKSEKMRSNLKTLTRLKSV